MGIAGEAIRAAAAFAADAIEAKPLGGGNINETFLVTRRCGARFVLQRISTVVFPDPGAIMGNLRAICAHASRSPALAAAKAGGGRWEIPRPIPSLEGPDVARDSEGGCWRAIEFISGATAWPCLRGLGHAREVGRALGLFQSILADMPEGALADTLPGYHETPAYLRAFDRIASAPEARARAAGDPDCLAMERFIEAERPRAPLLLDALARGDLRLRPIHGDPKVANVMIDDSTGLAVAIIDLDTAKPGLVHYDFGDCVRSACNPAGEDPEDPRSVRIDLDALREVATGYLSQAAGSLSDADAALLYDSVRMIAFELSLRFFTDYLDGSRYFRVTYPAQNLRRATVQRLLCEDITRREGQIRRMLDGLWKQTCRRNS